MIGYRFWDINSNLKSKILNIYIQSSDDRYYRLRIPKLLIAYPSGAQNINLTPNWQRRGLSAETMRPNVGEPTNASGKLKFV
jgi:hypothetical protein